MPWPSTECSGCKGKVRAVRVGAAESPNVGVPMDKVTDNGNVRLGGFAPSVAPADKRSEATKDSGKVKTGGGAINF